MKARTCVRCKKKISQRTRICPFCSMPNKILPTKPKALCPVCKKPLKPKFYKHMELDVCPSCFGIWLDTLEFAYITSKKDVYSDSSLEPVYVPEVPHGSGKLYKCVRCTAIMNRVNFKRISGILIDVCGDHGVWLDNKELEKIRHFIASGGLDKARDKVIQKNVQDLKVLASRVDTIRFMQNTLHRWSLKRILLRSGNIME